MRGDFDEDEEPDSPPLEFQRAGIERLNLPAKVKRTGMRQIVVSLGDAQARQLEELRLKGGYRSWGQVIRTLIAWEAKEK